MTKIRLLFSKTGRAKYMSHLDLLRTFQRTFRRADIALRHTEGFNPHPYLVFALPLSVGTESVCELVDIELAAEAPEESLPQRLTAAAPEGIEILRAYSSVRKFADIKWLEVEGRLCYDNGAAGAADALKRLFGKPSLVIAKKTKKGMGEADIMPAVGAIRFKEAGSTEVAVSAVVSAQFPTLNPDHLITAVRTHLPAYAPDFASFKRIEIFDRDRRIFR